MPTSSATLAAPGPREAKAPSREPTPAWLTRHGWRVLLVFAGLLLPMWGFAELADEVHEGEPLPFDQPLLEAARAVASERLDTFFVGVTRLGYEYGLVPFDIGFVLVLAWLRHRREALFAALALGGSALLNMGTKALFARDRPSLWESIAPEETFSFPSGHAMGSATLAGVLVLLAWRTRWRWPVLLAAMAGVLLVGTSRVYLGVHYPSDILAGWAAASIWAAACFLLLYGLHRHPWTGRATPPACSPPGSPR